MTEAEKLLKEARKIMLANTYARWMNKDFLQRVSDYFRKQEKEQGR